MHNVQYKLLNPKYVLKEEITEKNARSTVQHIETLKIHTINLELGEDNHPVYGTLNSYKN